MTVQEPRVFFVGGLAHQGVGEAIAVAIGQPVGKQRAGHCRNIVVHKALYRAEQQHAGHAAHRTGQHRNDHLTQLDQDERPRCQCPVGADAGGQRLGCGEAAAAPYVEQQPGQQDTQDEKNTECARTQDAGRARLGDHMGGLLASTSLVRHGPQPRLDTASRLPL